MHLGAFSQFSPTGNNIRMTSSSSLVCLVVCVLSTLTHAHEVNESAFLTHEHQLYTHLLDGYEKALRPVRNHSDNVTVSIGLALLNIYDLDEETQVMRSVGWLRTSWTDFRFTWNPENFGGVLQINIPVQDIWTPDIMVYNSVLSDLTVPLTHMAILYHDGSVMWVPPVSLETNCAFDLSFFPFDKQTCHIKFGSWTYSGEKLDIIEAYGGVLDISSYTPSPQWDLIDGFAKRNVIYYSCCPEPYIDITYTFVLQRHAAYSLHLFLAPSVTLSLIIPIVFAMPAGSTEKISMGVGVLISHVLLLGEFIRFVPTAHHHSVPLMAHFFVANIVVVALSLVISTVIVNCWSRGISRRTGPPAILKMIFLNQVITRILCIDFSQYLSANDVGIDNPVMSVSHLNVESASSDRISMSDDRVRIMQDKERHLAASEWRHLADVMDRLFFFLYLMVVTVMCLGFLKYL